MDDVGKFLDSLGLARYDAIFAENDIDFAALRQLHEAHLKELGVSLGHRLRLLQAIAALPTAAEAPAVREASPAAAERRQVSVMFCDLVGSSTLAQRIDAEDMRDIMRDYQAACASVVARFEGHLAQFLGDGVLAYFGYPQAHEDAAERAVRAALGIVKAVGRLAPHASGRLSARLGIATGMVIVGKVMDRRAFPSSPRSVRHRIWPHACRRSLSPTPSSLPKARVRLRWARSITLISAAWISKGFASLCTRGVSSARHARAGSRRRISPA